MRDKSKFDVKRSRFIFKASQMPPLSHWPDRTVPFAIKNSEMCRWFMEQDWFWEWLLQKAQDAGAIVFDPGLKKWVGTQTDEGQKLLVKP